jgi:DNA-binding beta-propeller fold protein YncE
MAVAAAMSPDGKTMYAVDYGFPANAPGKPGHTVTPIRTATRNPGKPIRAGTYPVAIVVVPAARM